MCYFSKTSNIFYNIFFVLYNKSDLFRQSLPVRNILSMTIGFGAYEYQLVSICDNDKIIINIIFYSLRLIQSLMLTVIMFM